tara:strand:+ start:126 stop:764 length:639 start_codon:yes stop_codon:yes gene_type:complete
MCDKNITIDENSNFSSWENRSTTRDEREIIKFLIRNIQIINNKKILHVGIGNSSLGNNITKYSKFIDGITISINEVKLSNKYNCYKNIHICNKYNLNDLSPKIGNKYDIIIDQGIKQYTCCNQHFIDLFCFYMKNLEDGGILITSKYGMAWSGYDIYNSIKLKDNENTGVISHGGHTNPDKTNVLSEKELDDIVNKYGFRKDVYNSVVIIYK